jgi:L-histidine N-alpha-methyltransferase
VPGRDPPSDAAASRFRLLRQQRRTGWLEMLGADAQSGLKAERKQLPPKYFYDARGSQLFDQITRLPEYYQTEAEREILERVADSLVAELRPRALVEFGSGSADKTRVLLDAMDRAGLLEGFGPFDVSESALVESADRLLNHYPALEVIGVLGDFEWPHDLPFADRPRIVAFLGSTIGNLTRSQAVDFLRQVAEQMSPDDGFLIGFDLVKDTGRLEAAYNDSQGVTREFNLNVLGVLNRELDADFDLSAFHHLAFYNAQASRIELHLVSEAAQTVRLRALDMTVDFEESETILTELSYKYTRDSATDLLTESGLTLVRWETDPGELFALGLACVGR